MRRREGRREEGWKRVEGEGRRGRRGREAGGMRVGGRGEGKEEEEVLTTPPILKYFLV